MARPTTSLIAAFVLLAGAGYARADSAVVESRLNLRAGPGAAFGVIAVLEPGSKVIVQKCHGTWCRVRYQRQVGYTSRVYLSFGAESYAAATPTPPVPPDAAKPKIAGPRIWRWRDPEWRNRHWRQFGWRKRHKRP
jgi:uncharacterized protein YraI